MANMAKGKRNKKKSSKGPDDGENENGDEGKYINTVRIR